MTTKAAAIGAWTTLGNLASACRPVVDQRGLVTPRLGGWSLDWWIGADDRWHFPSHDTGVRQRLVDGTPVVETAMRIPGGDAVHRVYVVRVSGPPGLEELLVVEIHNQSRVPFALALAIRPYNPLGPAMVQDIDLAGATVTVRGRAALLLPGPPRLMAGSTLASGDCAAVVAGGGASDVGPWPVRCPSGLAQAAFLYPLAHTASLRVAMPLSPAGDRRPRYTGRSGDVASVNPSRLPSAADAARAWQAQTRRGLRLDLPAGRLADAVEANRRYLLLFHETVPTSRWPEAAFAVVALDGHGFHGEAAEMLATGLASRAPAAAGAALSATAEHWRLTGDAELLLALVPAIAGSLRRIRAGWLPLGPRSRRLSGSDTNWVSRGLLDGASLLSVAAAVAGHRVPATGALSVADCTPPGVMAAPAAAAREVGQRCGAGDNLDAHAMLRLAAVELEAGDRRALGHLEWLMDAATPTWVWPEAPPGGNGHHAATAVEFCSLVRNLVVREVPGGLSLLTLLPDSWLGQAIDVHDAPTHAGVVSYAVRWHGERPALLWELQPRDGVGPTRLTAPGLDSSWSSVEPAGEALLAPRARTSSG